MTRSRHALARQLHGLNGERREIEHGILDEAVALVGARRGSAECTAGGLCVLRRDWHEGVIGIVAARLRERWHRPTIVFADGGDGLLRGSARSIDGLHIRDAIDAVDKRHPGLIVRFGGHAMAAGLSLPRDGLDDFRAAFARRSAPARRRAGGARDPVRRRAAGTADDPAHRRRPAPLRPLGQGLRRAGVRRRLHRQHKRIAAERHLKLRVQPDGACRWRPSASAWPSGATTSASGCASPIGWTSTTTAACVRPQLDVRAPGAMTEATKWVFAFEEGDGKNKKLLGGKGANLCEMTQIGLNVPPGFVITTEACLAYLDTADRACRPASWTRCATRWRRWSARPARASATRTTRCWCRCAPARRCPCRA
jgi:hypothetical protein